MVTYDIIYNMKRAVTMDWITIGIKVPSNSDLPGRFKALAEKTRLSYGALFEQFIVRAEADPEQEAGAQSDISIVAAQNHELKNKIMVLEETMARTVAELDKINTKLENMQPSTPTTAS